MKYRMRFWSTGSALLFFLLVLHTPSSAHADVGNASAGAAQSMDTAPENKKCATFSCVDTDHDNAVSRKELTNYGDPSLDFDEIDTDDDESLSMAEWNGRDGAPPPTVK